MGQKQEKILVQSNAGSSVQYTQIDGLKVKNQTYYNQFLKLRESPWITEKRFYQSQNDKLLQIDLLARDDKIKKAIRHLPDNEQKYIYALRNVVTNAYNKLTTLKKAALGESGHSVFYGLNYDDYLVIDNRKAEILAMFGKMWSIQEVHREIVKEWGIDISINAIQSFRAKNLEKILELQKEYTNNFKTVRLAHKKSRLEEYLWLYLETKEQYQSAKSRDDRKFLKDLLESIRREVDGDVLRIEGDVNVNIEHTLNIHIHRELFKKLPINEIIITRVATRTGINPLLLLYRLQNSYYAKYTGFAPKDEQKVYDLPEYPSAQVYDLNKLMQMNQEVNKREQKTAQVLQRIIDIPHTEVKKAKTVKELIREKLLKRQKELENNVAQIEIQSEMRD